MVSTRELIGGCTRILAVRRKIDAMLEGKALSTTFNKEEAGRGVTFSCAMLSPVPHVRDFDVVHGVSPASRGRGHVYYLTGTACHTSSTQQSATISYVQAIVQVEEPHVLDSFAPLVGSCSAFARPPLTAPN